ncbi:MAG: Xaa-Pro peptidase family protein, partial [Pseudomonadota bacterium]
SCAKSSVASRSRAAISAQESLYWLSGHDTFGFCFFQCLVVGRSGPPTLLVRSADKLQARHTSWVEDVRVWRDRAEADPSADLAAILQEAGLKGARLGVELDTHGLTAANWRKLEARLGGWARLVDASDLVSTLRLTKSPAELAYVRRAAEIGDACFEAAMEHIRPGADEGLILAAMQGECFASGGDYPGNPFIIGSGPVSREAMSGALLCRYYTGRRTLSAEDQLTLEWAGVYRQYHAALMRTVVLGKPKAEHLSMHAAAKDALLACEAALTPGRTMGEVFEAHARAFDAAGLGHARLNACGYALGARYAPSWMEREMFYADAPTMIGPNMVFFLHMILMDKETGAAMTLGRSSITTEGAATPLSALPLEIDAV